MPKETESGPEELLARCERLGKAAEQWRRAALRCEQLEPGPAAAAGARDARGKWYALAEEHRGLPEGTVVELSAQLAETRGQLREATEENARLHRCCDRLKLQLRRQLGITPKKMGAQDSATSPEQPQAEGSDEERTSCARGAPRGHRGATRPVPGQVDRTVLVPPPALCRCGGRVEPLEQWDRRYTEDIPPVCREVVLKMYQRGVCADCGNTVRHTDALKGPPVATGPNLAVLLTVLRHMGMTCRRLAAFCTTTLGISLTPSGVMGIVNRVCDRAEPAAEEIASLLPEQNVIGVDETGWKIRGRNGYIWCFCNRDLVYFHPNVSRAGAVPEAFLGATFEGTVTCDFYAAYNRFPNLQRCWIHLLRDIETERKIRPASKLLEQFEDRAWDLYEEGGRIQALDDGPEKQRSAETFRGRLTSLSRAKLPRGQPVTIAARIARHLDELMLFLRNPEVEPHNNRAERQIRPLVVNRKNSFGSDTETGATRLCNLATVLETCRLNGVGIADWLRKLLLAPLGTPPSPFA